MSTPPLAASGMAPGPFAGPQAQQAAREVNTASLCRIGQETVQDIVYRTMEIFQLLRNMQLPNGVTYHTGTYQDRLTKLQDHLRQLSILFRKLRLVYDKCNENCGGMDPIPAEQLIPYVEEDGSKNDDRAGPARFASEERREIAEVNKIFGYLLCAKLCSQCGNVSRDQSDVLSTTGVETQTEESTAEANYGSITKSHLGYKCHVGNEELN
ncbi:mediator of RNA polymerase II transcription subunit 30 isoform X1 [Pteropus medius]|uniref:Mediator of RNA polymerase II transcription subunit 30 n=1 Tax=Pteropus vampyrus TaxID=132908 RepID=A0A6P6CHS8_PTEVA|nr:mediator of RNA polymerase II transcription subunit 30 isoform X1 [Pteropus vampyrus]XP_023386551.1 mediator of RNA polymerase II transcription subunit 30 isoform X2 [Pteropus vampyrus]XP_039709542.1 mediator of RNA polymerase II transcription subunit 30 isoform X1 [Pteropus giganteus]